MSKAIKDEFADLPLSRQRKYQLRMQRDQQCIICGESTVGGFYCLKHLVDKRERARRRIGAKKRLKGARSYRLEQEMQSTRRRRTLPTSTNPPKPHDPARADAVEV
jgi:hypothetical protein